MLVEAHWPYEKVLMCCRFPQLWLANQKRGQSRPGFHPHSQITGGECDKEDFESGHRSSALTLHVCVCACLCVYHGRTQTLKQRPCLSFCHSCTQCYSNNLQVAVTVKHSTKEKKFAYFKKNIDSLFLFSIIALSFIVDYLDLFCSLVCG